MDPHLAKLIAADTPKMNEDICEGLAVKELQNAEQYVHEVFLSAAQSFPPELKYHGYARATPEEEFSQVIRKKGNRRLYDTAQSDLYMVKFLFSFNGEMIDPRFIYLPTVGEAGSIKISGASFNIAPVLSDRVISVTDRSVFVRLLRDKLTFERVPHQYNINNKQESIQVVWSMFYHKNAKMRKLQKTVDAKCAGIHYLLCKYGFMDTMMMFGNCKPVVGSGEINENTYPSSEWVICKSSQLKPRGVGRIAYTPSQLRVAIKVNEFTPMVKNLLGGFFYIVDHFPLRIKPDHFGGPNEQRMWKILLGHILFSGTINEGVLHDDIHVHLGSLDGYVDGIVRDEIRSIAAERGIKTDINDLYQLIGVVIEMFNEWLLGSSGKINSLYDKKLNILYYLLFPISSAIFKFLFKIQAASKKGLTKKDVENQMNATLRLGLIYGITRGHGEVTTVAYPGDNKALKITSIMVPQSNSGGIGMRKDRAVINDPSKRIHPSVAEVAGYANLPKSDPSGHSRVNPYVRLDRTGVVQRNPNHVEMMDDVAEKIKR